MTDLEARIYESLCSLGRALYDLRIPLCFSSFGFYIFMIRGLDFGVVA